jgi:hypothetical protein
MDLRIKKLYWQITALLLAAHFAGWSAGLPLAMALTLLQVGHFGWYRRDLLAFEVQVRAGYLGFLLAGTLPGCWPLHVIQFVGVNAFVVAEYCLMARLLALAPWNRSRPLTAALLRLALLSPPVRGSIVDAVNKGRGQEQPPGRASTP